MEKSAYCTDVEGSKMKMKRIIAAVMLCITAYTVTVAAEGIYNPFFGRTMLYKNDFAGFVNGSKGCAGCTFTNDSRNGGAVGARIDDFHGTSLKIADLFGVKNSYWIDGYFQLGGGIQSGKYIFEFELYPVSEQTSFFSMIPCGSTAWGNDFFAIFGKNVKVGKADDENVGYRGELKLGEWNKIRIMLDMDNKKYTLSLNGRQLDDEKNLNLPEALTKIYFKTYSMDEKNHGDIYIDNVCLYSFDKEPDKDSIDWNVKVSKSGELSVLFDDDIDPALINKNNIALYKDGEKLDFAISEKSAFGCMLNPTDELKDAEYELVMNNVFGISGQRLTEDTILLRSTAGTYQYITDKQDYLTAEVTGGTVTVVNKTGRLKSYVILTGYYKDGVLHNMSSITGVSEASEIRKDYNIAASDGREIKAFIFDRELSDVYFNK